VGANLDEIAGLDRVRIIGETVIPVHHQLAARPEVQTPAVTTVAAHPKAFEECELWLAAHLPASRRIPLSSSAAAAVHAAADTSGATAAIASKTAADLYRLKILAADIENSPLNTTRFWVLGREVPPPTENDKTTLLVTGDLNAALARVVNAKIVILSLCERPSKGEIGSRRYFLDIAGHAQELPLHQLLRHFPEGRWLGSYPRA
jgi:prephenate dehydratase